jgi:hypothetical protein
VQLLKKLGFEQNQEVKKNDRNKPLISKEVATDTFCSLVTGTPEAVSRSPGAIWAFVANQK